MEREASIVMTWNLIALLDLEMSSQHGLMDYSRTSEDQIWCELFFSNKTMGTGLLPLFFSWNGTIWVSAGAPLFARTVIDAITAWATGSNHVTNQILPPSHPKISRAVGTERSNVKHKQYKSTLIYFRIEKVVLNNKRKTIFFQKKKLNWLFVWWLFGYLEIIYMKSNCVVDATTFY